MDIGHKGLISVASPRCSTARLLNFWSWSARWLHGAQSLRY